MRVGLDQRRHGGRVSGRRLRFGSFVGSSRPRGRRGGFWTQQEVKGEKVKGLDGGG